jgi:hypothetical protein
MGFMQIMGGVVASGLISILPDNTQLPLAVAFVFCGLGIVIMVKLVAGERHDSTT